MDPEECRLAALHFFKESSGTPPINAADWLKVREISEFIMSGLIPGESLKASVWVSGGAN